MKKLRAKKRQQQAHSDFWDTVHDIRTLTKPHLQQNKGHFMEAPGKKKQKGLKMPMPILHGVRKSIIKGIKDEKAHNLEQNIQYRSDLKKDLSLLQTLDQRKNKFQKNQYKFKNMNNKKVGKFKNGMLQFSERDVNRIKQSK